MNTNGAIASNSERSTQFAVRAALLWTLTLLFAVRVLGQAVQRWWPQSFLPPFSSFQGSGLPYPLLLGIQLAILAFMVRASLRVGAVTQGPGQGQRKFLIGFGILYLAGSVARILIGLVVPAAPHWFTTWIPAFFHLVLASFVITIALDTRTRITAILPYLWYPTTLTLAIASFVLLLGAGTPIALAAYLPVFAVGVAILVLERQFPEKLLWRPRAADVRADVAFLALIQVALPRMLTLVLVLVISTWSHHRARSSLWPHAWPLAAQIVTMVLIVDFCRYWLHRACHHFPFLWRLHEVHHSPDILYVLNVGRFHPLEKLLHFTVDAVPFLLMGVAPQVIAGYFLLYSVNGFFQHSNLKLRYGLLNYVVGSAETHRWHHARDPRTAACNFSNTTIVWDLLFATWVLPPDRAVEDIGVIDRSYPRGFLQQLLAPFR